MSDPHVEALQKVGSREEEEEAFFFFLERLGSLVLLFSSTQQHFKEYLQFCLT
jgi:hypothetical protein